MKKLLFLSSSLFFSFSAYAQTIPEKNFKEVDKPVYLANGFVNFSAASSNQASAFEADLLPDNSKNYLKNSESIGNDTQLFFKAGVMTQSQAKYGAVAKVEFNINSDERNEKPNIDQMFLYSESDFGKVEFGNNFAVNQKMKTGPNRFTRGAGGVNGKYLEHVNLSTFGDSGTVCSGAACSNVKLPSFILLAQSPIGHGGNARSNEGENNFRALKDDSFEGPEDATKISYYSPRFEGLQLGVSYAPTSENNGFTRDVAQEIRFKNIFGFGANYIENFDNLGVMFSATGESAKVKNSRSTYGVEREDIFAYDLSATLSYFGFSLGASYGSWGKSLQQKNGIYSCDYDANATLSSQNCATNSDKFSDPKYFSYGLAYQFGPIAASVTGIKSEFQKNEYEAISLGVDYKLSKDLMPYFEVTKFAFKANQPSASDIANQLSVVSNQRQLKDNQGYVLLTGILFSF